MTTVERQPRWLSRRLGASSPGVTVHELDSGRPGPVLLVLGGVHGNETGGIVAAGLIATRQWPIARGKLRVVPITHEAAFEANTRESPIDGGNLARLFPGRSVGAATERLAALVDSELIAEADALLDMHTSSPHTDMPLFVGCVYDGTMHSQQAVRMANEFGIDVVWTHPTLGPGRTLSAAHARGIPALYVESPDGGVLNSAYLDAYVSGTRSMLGALGMVQKSERFPRPRLWLHGDGDVDTFAAAPVEGLFLRKVSLMDEVRAGDIVGLMLNASGELLAEVPSPRDGYVTTLRRVAVVDAGLPLVGVTSEGRDSLHVATDERSANEATT